MTSSDSGDDFESADEDFDFDRPKPSKQTNSVDAKYINENQIDLESRTNANSEANTTDCSQRLLDLKLEDNSEGNKEFLREAPADVQTPTSTINPGKISKITNKPSHTVDSFKGNRPEELDEKGTSPHISNLKEGSLTEKKNNEETKDVNSIITSNVDNISETNKESNTGLKTEVTSKLSDGWEIDEDEEILCEENTDENYQSKASNPCQVEEEDGKGKVKHKSKDNIEIKPKNNENIAGQVWPLNTEKQNPQDGWENEGWEIEEEDGFEIPTSLAKTSDGSILCAQEQICELDRVEFEPKKHQQVCTQVTEIFYFYYNLKIRPTPLFCNFSLNNTIA